MSKTNRLSAETSPYLLQHADNPVDWHPWGPDAIELARKTSRPILLSVGYSACHWCHVMAHESFEDEATAELMNKLFVNIKVDREERPDIDRIYQTAHQLLTQRPGGWPLTMFIDPADQRPFFGGTYFPDEPRHGLPSFRELLTRVAVFFKERQSDVRDQGQQIADILARLEPVTDADVVLDESPVNAARKQVGDSIDREYGGIGNAPKFPHPSALDRLLRHWRAGAHGAEPDVEALFLVSLTLTRMAEGGIYDQLGGGFSRYSVDRYWQIPHFEKMLYDNGPLLALYAQAHLATGEALFARIANETADWMLADMQAPNGGFYSTRDADSEGHEGRFYVWTPDQVRQLLPQDQFDVVEQYFGLNAAANFEGDWHLTVQKSVEEIGSDAGKTENEVVHLIDQARRTLFAERSKRIAPDRDEKQLTSWNALAIQGLAIAGRSLDRPDLVDAAQQAADFVAETMIIDGRLFASYKDDSVRLTAYLDDHAFMLDALLELLQARWNSRHLQLATTLADLLLKHFYDAENGGFFFTADDHEELMHRPKPLADDATPSGNGVAVSALQRLGFLLGETTYLDAAEKTLRNAWRAMDEFPHGHVTLITALDEYLHHPETIIIRGDADEIASWQSNAAKIYAPRRMVFAIPSATDDLPGALADRKADDKRTIAYRCIGSQCSLPVTSWNALAAELSEAT